MAVVVAGTTLVAVVVDDGVTLVTAETNTPLSLGTSDITVTTLET